MLDGEAIVTNECGLAVFDLIRRQRHRHDAVLIAFDLIELDAEDLRRLPIEQRKQTLTKLVRGPDPGITLNEHYVDGYKLAVSSPGRSQCHPSKLQRLSVRLFAVAGADGEVVRERCGELKPAVPRKRRGRQGRHAGGEGKAQSQNDEGPFHGDLSLSAV
jgi:hypothetical protein